MKRFWIFLILIILIGGGFYFLFFSKKEDQTSQLASMVEKPQEKSIRQPVVAGQFYPGDKEELTQMISQFLEQAELPPLEGQIMALVVPHAGYVYSGGVAAYGFGAIQGQDIKRVILIGSSHHEYLTGAVIDGYDTWQTPLGQIDLDTDLRNALVKESDLFKVDSGPHQPEHSLEVEVPFLQTVLENFKILPILVSQLADNDLERISQALAKHIGNQTLLVASSDMSHYPAYEKAKYADNKVIEAILTGQISNLRETINQLEKENIFNLATCLCGQTAVEVTIKVAQMNDSKIKLLRYANSGDVAIGDKSQVVGYSAIAFSWEAPAAASAGLTLNQEQKTKLLEIAKTSVEKYILERQMPEFEIAGPLLNENLGAFVTLKKHGQLRGCIGRFASPPSPGASADEANIPLYQVVSQMAVAAATQDTRFFPVQANELADLEYEVSVLSPLRQIADWREIEVGTHGVQVRKGFNSGVFLPQVATENNWDLEEFMDNLCEHKAGLSPDAWKTGEVDLYVFTAEVFGEE